MNMCARSRISIVYIGGLAAQHHLRVCVSPISALFWPVVFATRIVSNNNINHTEGPKTSTFRQLAHITFSTFILLTKTLKNKYAIFKRKISFLVFAYKSKYLQPAWAVDEHFFLFFFFL